jgi:heme-degrading monooxygenase HmoA
MFVRRTRVEGSPEKLDQTIENYRQQLLPELKQQAGFRGTVLLGNRSTGAGLSVTLWESEEAERASRPTGDRLRAQALQNSGGRLRDVESYEEVLREPSGAPQGAFMRVSSVQAAPDKLEEGIRFVREQVVPLLKQQTGFQAVLMGVNRENGRAYVTSAWESANARQASEAAVSAQRSQAGQLMGGQVSVEEYEVVLMEIPQTVGATRI